MSSNRVTATQKVATDLKVDASGVAVPVTDNGGSLTVDGTVTATGPLTDTQLRATAVPVSGTVTASGPLTDTQLRATAVPVSAASLPLPTGAATAALQAGGLPAALGAGGGLKVDGSGTALPVSGTVTAISGTATNLKVDASGVAVPVTDNSGSLTVDAPVGTPVFVRLSDGSSAIATLPVSLASAPTTAITAASLPLPSGASTAAKQPALGTAGTASADVITVQGIASGLPITTRLDQIDISQTPTVSNGSAYAVQDAVGGLLTFANAARLSGGTGILQTLRVLCKTPALMPALELWLFNVTFTAMSDNGTWSPSDADMANYIGHIPISAWGDTTTNSGATRFGLGFSYALAGTSLFGQLVTRTAATLTSTSDIIIGITCIRD